MEYIELTNRILFLTALWGYFIGTLIELSIIKLKENIKMRKVIRELESETESKE